MRLAGDPELAETAINTANNNTVRHPQLAWNRNPNPAPRTAGPLYRQDHISPQQLIQSMTRAPSSEQLELISHQHNGFPPEASYEPYQHLGNWTNRLIHATGQKAMRSLLYKESRKESAMLVYFDPPYNINFNSQWQVSDDDVEMGDTLDNLSTEPTVIKAFRDTYHRGVHSYLDDKKEQLELARELLCDEGSIIVQIGPDNVHEMAILLSEVFGKENHIATIPYITSRMQAKFLGQISNWLLWYGKDKEKTKYRQLYRKEELGHYAQWSHSGLQDRNGNRRPMTSDEKKNPNLIPQGWEIYRGMGFTSSHTSMNGRSDTYYHHEGGNPCPDHGWSQEERESAAKDQGHPDHTCKVSECETPLPDNWNEHECSEACHTVEGNRRCPKGRKCGPNCHANAVPAPPGRHWSVSLAGLHSIAAQNRLYFEGAAMAWQHLQSEHPGRTLGPCWDDAGIIGDKQYIVETPPRVLERCILMTTDPGDLVVDLTCGSGALPIQCEEWGRRWISIDVSAVAIAIARERIATTTYANHVLADTPEGHREDHSRRMALLPPEKRTQFQPKPSYRNDPAKGFVNERQLRVSAKTLAYGPDLSEGSQDVIVHPDRTLRDNRKIRVAGPYTVEAASPHRAITPQAAANLAANNRADNANTQAIRQRIVDYLQQQEIKDGPESTFRLENILPAPDYDAITHTAIIVTEKERQPCAVYLADEDETLSATRLRTAGDLLLQNMSLGKTLIGIAFANESDAPAVDKAFRNLSIKVLNVNRDLQLPELKEHSNQQSFTVISEPELEIIHHPDSTISIKLLGITAFNPATGQIEPRTGEYWQAMMIDTDYDNDRFRVGLMNLKPRKRNRKTIAKLQQALKQTVAEDLFAKTLTTESLPFKPGEQVAVKVISPTGVEHMKVLRKEDLAE